MSVIKGKEVSLEDALDGCEFILSDEFKDLPEKHKMKCNNMKTIKPNCN